MVDDILFDQPRRVALEYGNVYPPRPPQPLPTTDPRTAALKVYADFLSTLEFRVPGMKNTNETIKFQVPRNRIYIEEPDNVDDGASLPRIVFSPGRGKYDYFNLGPARVLEDTVDVWAPGTALISPGDYVETFTLEVWAAKRAERRAIIAGIEATMLDEETSTTLRLILPRYYEFIAEFSLENRELVEEPVESVRNRRRAHLYIELRVQIGQLVAVNTLKPYVFTEVGPEVDLTEDVGV